jgi:hypothetical protein
MNFMGFLASLIVSMDCIENAIDGKQHIFAIEYSWLWYFIASMWLCYALIFLLKSIGIRK